MGKEQSVIYLQVFQNNIAFIIQTFVLSSSRKEVLFKHFQINENVKKINYFFCGKNLIHL